ncbi:hypothetical protein CBR_g23485 [Chara braunii]|uniref:NAD(P)-binding domain-containing protein n=1 Tax=Chara braunii TaxID=69332 RepID=A0A388L4J1_CHABU|nr:hypothetical protein CBR_g23485 [Chara braunii]|eukprot:GBG77158.1 hypothetical protein CBR_g23485 [Chara braunii]
MAAPAASASASASASMLCARGTPAAAVHGVTREYAPASSCAGSIRDLDLVAQDTSSRLTPRSGDGYGYGNDNGNGFFLVAGGKQQLRRSSFLPILPSALSAGSWSRGLAVPLWGPGATGRMAGKKRRALRVRAVAGSSQSGAGPSTRENKGLPFGLGQLNRSKKESTRESQRDDGLVFVAGATGRVGVRLVRVLLKLGFRVRAGVRSKDKALPLLQAARTYNLITADQERLLEIVEFDLDNVETLPLAVGNAGKVVCTVGAAETAGITTPYQVDYIGTKNLIDAAAKLKVSQFVLVSSLGTGKFGLPAGILNVELSGSQCDCAIWILSFRLRSFSLQFGIRAGSNYSCWFLAIAVQCFACDGGGDNAWALNERRPRVVWALAKAIDPLVDRQTHLDQSILCSRDVSESLEELEVEWSGKDHRDSWAMISRGPKCEHFVVEVDVGGRKVGVFLHIGSTRNFISRPCVDRLRLGDQVQRLNRSLASTLANKHNIVVQDYVKDIVCTFSYGGGDLRHEISFLVSDELPFDMLLGMYYLEVAKPQFDCDRMQ